MQPGCYLAGIHFLHVLAMRKVNESGESAHFVSVTPCKAQPLTHGHCWGIPYGINEKRHMPGPYTLGGRATGEWHTKRQKIRESLNEVLDLALRKLLRYSSMHVHLENKSFYSINNLYHLVKNKLVLQCTDSCSNIEIVNTQESCL